MANQIEIFNIDFGDTIESINKLKAELKETKRLFELAKPNTEEFSKYGAEIKRLDGTIKALNGATKENVNALGGINTATKFASGSYGELKQKIDQQKKALLELNVNSKEFADTQEDLIKLQEQRITIEKKIPSLFQERIKGAIDESNSLKQLKIDLREAQSLALNGDGQASKRVAELKDKIDDLKDSTRSLQGSGVERLNTSIGLLTQGLQDFDTDKIKTGFKGIGSAMSAIPIFLLVEGIKLLIDNFEDIVKFGKMVTGTFSVAEQNVQKLTIAVEKESIANKNLIASYSREIELLEAKGGHEKEILELKKKKIAVEIAEAENTLRLNVAKVAEAVLNNSITDSINGITIALFRKLGATETADKLEEIQSKARKARVLEEQKDNLKAIQDSQLAIAESKNALLILDIEYNKKQVENSKKATKEKNKLLEKEKSDKEKADAEYLKKNQETIDAQIKQEQDLRKAIKDVQLKSLEKIKKGKEQALTDSIALAQTELYNNRLTNDNFLESKIELLNAQREQELSNTELTEAQKAEVTARYREQEYTQTLDYHSKNLESAGNFANALGDLSNSLFELRRKNLVKGSEEDKAQAEKQFKTNKAFSITNAIINGASAIMNALGTVQPYYLAVAAAVSAGITTASQIATISAQKFQYFDGGYTQTGNPTEQAESIGNSQFHKGEYVIPNKILTTPTGSKMASQLEAMRKGFNPSNISGFFDGGYTSRSASATAINNNNNQQQILDSIKSLPSPVVKVTDINKVNTSVNVAMNVSSL